MPPTLASLFGHLQQCVLSPRPAWTEPCVPDKVILVRQAAGTICKPQNNVDLAYTTDMGTHERAAAHDVAGVRDILARAPVQRQAALWQQGRRRVMRNLLGRLSSSMAAQPHHLEPQAGVLQPMTATSAIVGPHMCCWLQPDHGLDLLAAVYRWMLHHDWLQPSALP